MGRVKRICVFEHFNCSCPAIQRGQGSGFLSEGSSWLTALWASSGGSGETARMRRLALTFAARIGDNYQIRLTRLIFKLYINEVNDRFLFHILAPLCSKSVQFNQPDKWLKLA